MRIVATAQRLQPREDGRIEAGRDGRLALEPEPDLLVRHVEQRLELVQLGRGEPCELSRREGAEDQIELAGSPAAVPGTISRLRRVSEEPPSDDAIVMAGHIAAGRGAGASVALRGAPPISLPSMRPAILFPLFAETRTLAGIGPKLEKLIARVAGARLVDLIFHLPAGVIDRSYRPRLIEAETGRIATLTLNVLDHVPPHDRRQPYRVRCSDETSMIELVFFHGHADYLQRMLPVGSQRVVSGRIEHFQGRPQMAHPDYILTPDEASEMPLIEPIYRLTEGLRAQIAGARDPWRAGESAGDARMAG